MKEIFRFDTQLCADSVEWCPHEPNQNVFVCGNYQLLDEKRGNDSTERVGRILLFSISKNNGLTLHEKINTDAVLDQKWCHYRIEGSSYLGVVTSEKSLIIYKLVPSKMELEEVCSFAIKDNATETLLLSLDWSTGKYNYEEPQIICSDSKGCIHLFKLTKNSLILINTTKHHEFEAWIAAFYYWDPNIYFSGGDDYLFIKHDKRSGIVAKNRIHEAGVTSMHSNHQNENILVTGSYDENIRIWDERNVKQPITQLKMPGTLWRVKWDPFNARYLLAACMLGGVHIVDTQNYKELKIISSFKGHKNISYGADWSFMKTGLEDFEYEGNAIVASCSFYDHLLCISKAKCEDL